MVGLNNFALYVSPSNIPNLGAPYLYFGFLPIATASDNGVEQGVEANGSPIKFTSCDTNAHSSITLFANFHNQTPSTYGVGATYPFCTSLFNADLPGPPGGTIMPDEYFMFGEFIFGGGGCYQQTDRLQSSGIDMMSMGFR